MPKSSQELPELLEKFLLSTRCLGHATSFPHSLMQNILARLDENADYAAVIKDLISRNLIVKAGKKAFDVNRDGFNHIAYNPTAVLTTIKVEM